VLAPASFTEAILAIHILAVVVAFGVTFTYPLLAVAGNRQKRAMPTLHRYQLAVSRMVINPGLLVILLAGIYLASKEHQWSSFYVQWGIGAVIVLGAAEGALIAPRGKRLVELAERDIAAAGSGEVTWSDEYNAVFRQIGTIGVLLDVVVVLTVFFMALHVGAS
jgi:uncharacterized membrane protein